MPAPPRPTLPSPSSSLRLAAGPWWLLAAIVLWFVFCIALAVPLAWAIVWLSHALGPFSVWYSGLFPQ